MQKMPPAIFTGTVFGLLQSFGLGTHIVILRNYTINTCIRILYHAIFRTSLV